MLVTGYDSTTPRKSIPPNPVVVFPYMDGRYRWDHSIFPHAAYKTITVTSDLTADIADVERYDMTVQDGINWAKHKWANQHAPGTLYCNKSNLRAVADGLMGVPHFFFVADYTDEFHMYSDIAGVVATQFKNDISHNIDISAVDTSWLNNTNAPNWGGGVVKDMDVMMNDGKTWFTVGNGKKKAVVDGTEGSALSLVLPVVKQPVPQYLNSIPTE